MLILDRDWTTFDPCEHPYGIIWLSGFRQTRERTRFAQAPCPGYSPRRGYRSVPVGRRCASASSSDVWSG
jgi:hypothetical protein